MNPDELYGWLQDLIPKAPSLIIDVGAGSGRDATWLAAKGHQVVAVEPSSVLLNKAKELTKETGVRWINDSLPGLIEVSRSGLSADMVLVNAVWQHVAPDQRRRAFRKLVRLLRSGGLLAITLRHGPAEEEREMHPVSLEEIEQLARVHGMAVLRVRTETDRSGREEVSWTNVALRLPDDGTGSLPLLRHLILDQSKSSTYKLCLLRTLCRAADGSAGLARHEGETVILPIGLIALNWVRMYLPLLLADLPQTPTNRDSDGLSFAKQGFRALLKGPTSPLDLRVGSRFGPESGAVIHHALQDVTETIATMPARYLAYPNGGPILKVRRTRSRLSGGNLLLDAACLWSFGELHVPRDLWQAMSRFAAWIEPALLAEWMRIMQGYAEGQGRRIEDSKMISALTWSDPDRDVSLPRKIATDLLDEGVPLHCVWSGRRLDRSILDIDHCLPWSAWPCGDLWNLVPSHRSVNQHEKKGKLPSHTTLLGAHDAIVEWWNRAYLGSKHEILVKRFATEAASSLPGAALSGAELMGEEVFAGVTLQRLRLWQDQKVPEWNKR